MSDASIPKCDVCEQLAYDCICNDLQDLLAKTQPDDTHDKLMPMRIFMWYALSEGKCEQLSLTSCKTLEGDKRAVYFDGQLYMSPAIYSLITKAESDEEHEKMLDTVRVHDLQPA